MHRRTRYALTAAVAVGVWLVGSPAQSQSTANGAWKTPSGSGNKEKVRTISTNEAVVAARSVLVKHGYEVVRVDVVRDTRVIYYRLGNRGRGRGKGRLMKIVVRRDRERVIFDHAPKIVVVDINVRLGL